MSWNEHVAAWSHPPVDDVGYLPSADMLAWDDLRLMTAIRDMARVRYGGWRNHAGLWRDMLKIDETHGMDVLDFGCGVGMESLEFVRAGNRVSLADISGTNLALAHRVVNVGSDRRLDAVPCYLVIDESPFLTAEDASFDVIHCAGVLHHIPWARMIMERFHGMLRPGGEVRLMLYSDKGWELATGTEVPHWGAKPEDSPHFNQFVRYFDSVGEYADWYDAWKIEQMFGDLFYVDEFAYLTEDYRYCAAVLTRRDRS